MEAPDSLLEFLQVTQNTDAHGLLLNLFELMIQLLPLSALSCSDAPPWLTSLAISPESSFWSLTHHILMQLQATGDDFQST